MKIYKVPLRHTPKISALMEFIIRQYTLRHTRQKKPIRLARIS